jgi:tetratricopeptide (TPR) repeat protein
MNCPKCGYDDMPDGARFCPNCGESLPGAPQPSTQVSVTQEVGSVAGGQVTGLEVGQVAGNVTIESTVNQIEAKIIQGDYVDRGVITNNILVLGDPRALDEILKRLMAMQGLDKQTLKNLNALSVPEHVGRQISEVMAAQKETAARGVLATPQTAYRLGMLAAYRRDYDEALGYFRQATQADPEYADAFEAIAWLQQTRANDDRLAQDFEAAISKLAEARGAAIHTDPLDPEALALRGYISKTLAQIAEARQRRAERKKYYQEAARLFEHAVQLDPDNASAHNGLGNVQHALGDLDTAISAYRQAIQLVPGYTAAHHDLALAYEDKMRADPANAEAWCREALQAWQQVYQLAPDDPDFSADYILTIGQHISWLKRQCG